MYMKKLLVLLMVAMGFTVTACNTVEGAGRDIEAAGESVSEAADETRDDITDGQE